MDNLNTKDNLLSISLKKKRIYIIFIVSIIVLLSAIILFIKYPAFKSLSSNQSLYGATFVPQKYDQSPTYPTAVYQKGKDFLAYGTIKNLDKKLSWVELQGANNTSFKTQLTCKGKIVEMSIQNNQRRIVSLKEGLSEMNLGDKFFGVCSNQTCQELKTCTLIKRF
ncbi:hypothetical protein HY383_03375 [Candidatus Daviesbacteria bacterium]|nr:hypothetical protein [Candidatus Daviesbacteria bacterium]